MHVDGINYRGTLSIAKLLIIHNMKIVSAPEICILLVSAALSLNQQLYIVKCDIGHWNESNKAEEFYSTNERPGSDHVT